MLSNEQNVQVCDATDDDSNCAVVATNRKLKTNIISKET